jgi:hypothetical protein
MSEFGHVRHFCPLLGDAGEWKKLPGHKKIGQGFDGGDFEDHSWPLPYKVSQMQ